MRFTRITVDPDRWAMALASPPESPTYLPLSDSGASLQLARMKREVLAHLELHPVDLRQKT
jgi:hypothetical protein